MKCMITKSKMKFYRRMKFRQRNGLDNSMEYLTKMFDCEMRRISFQTCVLDNILEDISFQTGVLLGQRSVLTILKSFQ